MKVKKARQGCLDECLSCGKTKPLVWYNVLNEFNKEDFATSIRESNGCCRLVCCGCHGYKIDVNEVGSKSTIMTIEKPYRTCTASMKCCCYSKIIVSSNNEKIGTIQERFYVCVPRFVIKDGSNIPIYNLHAPTCCCGMCVNCQSIDGQCLSCHEIPFHVYPYSQNATDGDVPFVSKIVKIPRGEANMDAFDVTFPENAISEHKALIASSTVLVDSVLFE